MRTFNISKGKVREPQTQFGISSKDQKLLSAFKLQSNYWEKRAGKKKWMDFSLNMQIGGIGITVELRS